MTKKHIYCIGIGGIGVSALARYYLSQGYKVSGSDNTDSTLIHALKEEGMDIIIGGDSERIHQDIELVVYSEAVPDMQVELSKARELQIKSLKYNKALAEVVNSHKLIAIAGTHGKSTTTSMVSQVLLNSDEEFKTIVGTLLKEFHGKNFFARGEGKNYFTIEACEYKEHFLEYKPVVAVITNIEYDHADYFKSSESYIQAYKDFAANILPGGFCILSGDEETSISLFKQREDIHYIKVFKSYFELYLPYKDEAIQFSFPKLRMKVPGDHILYDAKLAYIVGHMVGVSDRKIVESLENYNGVWRRMETLGETSNGNILMSDYGHHPSEIRVTLEALQSGYPEKKIILAFQPHQYSRTRELFDDFISCFSQANTLIISDIYESRDSEEDKAAISSRKLLETVKHTDKHLGGDLSSTQALIEKLDKERPNSSIIILMGAGNIDTLRNTIKTQ